MTITHILISCLIGTIAGFLFGIRALLILTFSLICVDWVTGVLASKKEKRGIAAMTGRKVKRIIESKKLRDTVDKVVVYMFLILVSRGIWITFFSGESYGLSYIAAAYIAYTEYISIVENAERVTGLQGSKAIIGFVFDRILPEGKKK